MNQTPLPLDLASVILALAATPPEQHWFVAVMLVALLVLNRLLR